jgi:hypothetical protein
LRQGESQTLDLQILNDAAQELSEDFQVVSTAVTGAAIDILNPIVTVVMKITIQGIHFDPLEVRVRVEPEVRFTVYRGADGQGRFGRLCDSCYS